MKTPKVTILISVHNGSKTLGTALDSIKKQTFKNYEVMIINDASSDSTEEIVLPYLEDKRFKYIINTKNIGQTASYNKAVPDSKGEYLAFLDDDNTWLPESLEALTKALDNNPTMQVAYGGRYFNGFWVEKNDVVQVEKREEPPYHLTRELVWNYIKVGTFFKPFIDTNNLFLRKKSLIEVGLWDPILKRKVDWELTMRLIEKYEGKFVRIHKPLTTYNLVLGDFPRNRETYRYLGYVYLKHKNNPLLKNQTWWPPDVKKPRLADMYKRLADLIRGHSLDDRSGKEINGNMLEQPKSQEEWNEIILKAIPEAKKYIK